MNDIGMYQTFGFSSSETAWQYISQSAYSDPQRTTPVNLQTASTDTSYYLRLRLKNTGGLTWQQASFMLGTNNPQDRPSNFYASTWLGPNRAARLLEKTVQPGESGTFEFSIETPPTATASNEYFKPLIEGKTWLSDIGLYWGIDTRL